MMPLEQAQRELALEGETDEEEHMSISLLQTRREKVESAEPIVPLVVLDSKGKAFEVPAGQPHRKRKISKLPVEETSKKVKLLAFAMSL